MIEGLMERGVKVEEAIVRAFNVTPNPLQRKAFAVLRETERNVLVTAPTGSGKTLIGYYAILLHGGGFYLAPLISLMMEKYSELKTKLRGVKVMVSNRDYRVPTHRFLSADIKIMSPYRFLSLAREIDPRRHGSVVVVDEIHKISDPLVEAAVTIAKKKGFRIVGLSATIHPRDVKLLSEWLDAEVVAGEERPVKLEYHVANAYQYGFMVLREMEVDGVHVKKNSFRSREEVAAYIASTLYRATGKPVIVWSPTRNSVQRIARLIANTLPYHPELATIASRMAASNNYERTLKHTIKHGVFIHHGGLSSSARRLVEKLYRERGGVIVTAYTLSHGVNLPARYLVMTTIYDWRGEPLTPTTFHQIAGRAGRPGYDERGTVIVVAVGEAEREYVEKVLLRARASVIRPSLLDDTVSSVKTVLPFSHDPSTVKAILRDTYSYLVVKDDEKIDDIMAELRRVKAFYEDVPERERNVAVSMGLYPEEYMIIKVQVSTPYKEGIREVLNIATAFFNTSPEAVKVVEQYGFLASIMARSSAARTLANNTQMVLEAGVHFAGKVWGWNSEPYRKALDFAKKFAYAGNPRVEPLANTVSIPTLRRMLKAAPQILTGAKGGEALKATVAAVKEAFLYWKRKPKNKVREVAELTWYAITGEQSAPPQLLEEVYREVYSNAV